MDQAPSDTGGRKVGRRGWRRLCFLGAAAILLVATPLSLSQSPCPDPLQPPEALSWEWWSRPIELHGEDRLPWVDADLLDVAAAGDGSAVHVIAAGRQGTIVASDDGGRSWRRELVRAKVEAPVVEVEPRPQPDDGNSSNKVDPKAAPQERPPASVPRIDRSRGKEDKGKAPDLYPAPAKGALLEWLVPTAHAAMEQNAANIQQTSFDDPAGWPPASEDLVAVFLEAWPEARAHGAAGSTFARKDGQWLPAGTRAGYATSVLSMSRRPSLCLLSTGDIVPVGAWAQRTLPPRLALARAVRSTTEGRVLAVAGDRVYRLANGWQPLGQPAPVPLRGLHFPDLDHGWVVGDGLVLRTSDGGQSWKQSDSVAPVPLNAVFFLPDGRRGWLAGNDGYLAETVDGGATFLSRTRPRLERPAEAATPVRLPPPWYALTWLGAIGLFFLGRAIPAGKEGPTELAVEPAFASDRPLERGDPDVLNLAALAAGLSRFLRNAATRPPLTLAITGVWGTGKSSLMNLLRADLRSFGFHPVWFNAWHHQKEEDLLASLLQSLRLQAIPAFWRIEGLLFRLHLLLIRGRKHALVLLAMLALTGLTFAYESGSGHKHDFAAAWKLARAWIDFLIDPTRSEPGETLFEGLHLAEIGSLTVLGVSVLRGLRAFGLNPGTLLASAAGSIKMKDLDAQTSFREKFRAEFADVTQALGPRKLIIFIDDLDRCQPEQVMEVLESVNFLVTSGECFVILGMDRDRVVPCVALSFKEIAAEMSGGKEDEKSRRDYANQYLDKLVNIEVPVPSLDAADAERLLAPEAPATLQEEEDPRRFWGLVRGFRELVDLVRPSFRFWPLALAAAVLLAGYGGGRALFRRQAPTMHAEPMVAKADQPSPPPAAAVGGLQVPAERSQVAQAIDREIAGRRAQTGQLVAGGGGSFPTGIFLLVLLAAWMLFLLVQIAQLRPETVVRDSSEFTGALKAWRTLIFKSAATPRALRRFQNRVRFLSMRQRRTAEERPWWKRLDWFRRQPVVEAASELETAPIPEPTLVALAAIYQSHPELLDSPLTAEKAAAIVPPPPKAIDSAALAQAPWNAQALAEEVSRHREQFLYRVRGFRVR
ncbi:MAG TPA: P-loop NTPase fold protein [Polyangia bacterium]|nr:P-loop NTPase fold protein [Polyangia bacterium]